MACRSLDKGQKVAEEILSRNPGLDKNQLIVLKLDLASSESIKAFVQDFDERKKLCALNKMTLFYVFNTNIIMHYPIISE